VIHSVARAQANLAGVAGHFSAGSDAATIDLGELTSGKRGTAYLQVRSNISAQLAFRSASGGYLVNASTPQSRVRYTMELAGVPVDLRGPASVAIGPQMSINGTAIEIAVTVGEVTGAAAGRYLDTVTIDIS
jgi:hypothetical protein